MNTKIKSDTIARTIFLAVALLNQFLAMFGKETLKFTEDEIYQVVSIIATFVATIIAWWKNNSFTREAIVADEYLRKLKDVKNE